MLLRWLSGKSTVPMQESQVQSLGGEDSPGEGNGTPLQCSCLENSMDRGAWCASVHGAAKSWTGLRPHTQGKVQNEVLR